eukprot:s1402_g1.t2
MHGIARLMVISSRPFLAAYGSSIVIGGEAGGHLTLWVLHSGRWYQVPAAGAPAWAGNFAAVLCAGECSASQNKGNKLFLFGGESCGTGRGHNSLGSGGAAHGFWSKPHKGIQICSDAFRTLVSGFHSAALCDPARDTQACIAGFKKSCVARGGIPGILTGEWTCMVSATANMLTVIAQTGAIVDSVVSFLERMVNLSVDLNLIKADGSLGSSTSIDIAGSLFSAIDAIMPGVVPSQNATARRLEEERFVGGMVLADWPSRQLQSVETRTFEQMYNHFQTANVVMGILALVIHRQLYPAEVPLSFFLPGQDIYLGKSFTNVTVENIAPITDLFDLPSLERQGLPSQYNYRYIQFKKFPYDFLVMPGNQTLGPPPPANETNPEVASLVPAQVVNASERLWHAVLLTVTDEDGNESLIDRSLVNATFSMLPKIAAYDSSSFGNVLNPSTCYWVDLANGNFSEAAFDSRGSIFSEDSCITMHTDFFAIFADDLAAQLEIVQQQPGEFLSQYDEEFTTTANVVTATLVLVACAGFVMVSVYVDEHDAANKVTPLDSLKTQVIDRQDPKEKVLGTLFQSMRRNHLVIGWNYFHLKLTRVRRAGIFITAIFATEALAVLQHSLLAFKAESAWGASGLVAAVLVFPIDSSCEEFAGKRLSAWQIAKKALWDRVRGASLEISMQEGALMQLSVEVEGIPGAAQDCPLGMLSIQLFLLDMLRVLPKSSQQTEIAAWFERLINQAIFQIQWSDVIRSGWPIFGLLARLSRLSQPVQLDRDIWRRIRPTGIPIPIDEIQAQLQNAINLELAEAGHSSYILLKSFFSPDSTALWTDISSQGQEYILKEAALKDDQLHDLAYYFLSHLRTEFAGFAGPVDPFLRSILGLSDELHRSTLSCWDVGAAPVPRNIKGERRKAVGTPVPLKLSPMGIGNSQPAAASVLTGDLSAFFPKQVGPPSQYAKAIQHWMHLILVLQACKPEMNITYISIWGAGCALGTLLDILAFVIPVATGLLKLELLATIVRIGTPCSELLGALTFDGFDPETNPILKGFTAAGSSAEKKYKDWFSTVDALLGADGILDILKVDVEGHEWQILQGAHRALSSGRIGLIILEYGDKWLLCNSCPPSILLRPTKRFQKRQHCASLIAVQFLEFCFEWLPQSRMLAKPPPRSAPAKPIPLKEQAKPKVFKYPKRPAVGKVRPPEPKVLPRAPHSLQLPVMPTLQLKATGSLAKGRPQPPARPPGQLPRPPQEPPPPGHLLARSQSDIPELASTGFSEFSRMSPGTIGPFGLTLPELPPLPQGNLKAIADGKPAPSPPPKGSTGPRPPKTPPPVNKMFFVAPKGVPMAVPALPAPPSNQPRACPPLPKLPPTRTVGQLSTIRSGGSPRQAPPPAPPPHATPRVRPAGLAKSPATTPMAAAQEDHSQRAASLPGAVSPEEVVEPRAEDVEQEAARAAQLVRDPEHTMPARDNEASSSSPNRRRRPVVASATRAEQLEMAEVDLPNIPRAASSKSTMPLALPKGMQAYSQEASAPGRSPLASSPVSLSPGADNSPLRLAGSNLRMDVPKQASDVPPPQGKHAARFGVPVSPPSNPKAAQGPEAADSSALVRRLPSQTMPRHPPKPPPKVRGKALLPTPPSGPPPAHAIVLPKGKPQDFATGSELQAVVAKAKPPPPLVHPPAEPLPSFVYRGNSQALQTIMDSRERGPKASALEPLPPKAPPLNDTMAFSALPPIVKEYVPPERGPKPVPEFVVKVSVWTVYLFVFWIFVYSISIIGFYGVYMASSSIWATYAATLCGCLLNFGILESMKCIILGCVELVKHETVRRQAELDARRTRMALKEQRLKERRSRLQEIQDMHVSPPLMG